MRCPFVCPIYNHARCHLSHEAEKIYPQVVAMSTTRISWRSQGMIPKGHHDHPVMKHLYWMILNIYHCLMIFHDVPYIFPFKMVIFNVHHCFTRCFKGAKLRKLGHDHVAAFDETGRSLLVHGGHLADNGRHLLYTVYYWKGIVHIYYYNISTAQGGGGSFQR